MKKSLLLLLIILWVVPLSVLAQSDDDATPEATLEPTEEPLATEEPMAATEEPLATEEPAAPSCPDIVADALTITREGCVNVGQDQLCYGHLVLDAQLLNADDQTSRLELPGDRVDVVLIDNLSLAGLDVNTGTWGVALAELQADIPQADQSNVTLLLFGDVSLDNAAPLLSLDITDNVPYFDYPEIGSNALGRLEVGAIISANGRFGNDWLRVRVSNEPDGLGWVLADSVTVKGDLEDLREIDPDSQDPSDDLNFGPLQAFYFASGRDDSPCAEAPNSGLLIQTPEGEATVTIWLDEVVIELNATAFVQADASGNLTVNVLEGEATVTSEGQSVSANAGQRVNVPLDENLGAAGVPGDAEAYDLNDLGGLPTTLLNQDVTPAAPLEDAPIIPRGGTWAFGWGGEGIACADGTEVPLQILNSTTTVTPSTDGSFITTLAVTYINIGNDTYSAVYTDTSGVIYRNTLTVNSSTSISGNAQITLPSTFTQSGEQCVLNIPFSLSLGG